MERKFTFDDMKFVAKAERVEGTLQVGIYDAWDECLLSAEYPETPPAKTAGRKRKGAASGTDEEQAIAKLIEQFQQKVEEGEIDLA